MVTLCLWHNKLFKVRLGAFFVRGGGWEGLREGYCNNWLFLIKSTRMYVTFFVPLNLKWYNYEFYTPLDLWMVLSKKMPYLMDEVYLSDYLFWSSYCNVNAYNKGCPMNIYYMCNCLNYWLRNTILLRPSR